MGWTCYGFLDQCRVGTAYFRSGTDGLCINDAEQIRYNGITPFRIVFCVINEQALTHPHRQVTGWRDGQRMWTVLMLDSWDHMELTYDMQADGIWEFKLQDSDTSEVLCSRMIGLNKDPIFEEEIPDEDVGEDVIDYDRIKDDMIDIENDLMGKIKYLDLVNDMDRNNDKNELKDKIDEQSNKIVGWSEDIQYFTYLSTQSIISELDGVKGVVNNALSGVINKMDALAFPTTDSIKETFISTASEIADQILERIWDEIEKRYEK